MLPLAVANSDAFNALLWGDQKLLFDLYIVFEDCERFTIDIKHPEHYRHTSGVNLVPRIRRLLAAGLLEIDGSQKARFGNRRVFKFPQPPDCQPAIAGSGQTTQPLHP